jgi:hypothetical protein
MKILAGLVLLCVAIPAHAQQREPLPSDGNGLLEACNIVIQSIDNPAAVSSLSPTAFDKAMMKYGWCIGYLNAIQDVTAQRKIQLGIAVMMGVAKNATEKDKQDVFQLLRGPCLPERSSALQLARVVVKWLQNHPEQLHEHPGGLVYTALNDAFPCQTPDAPSDKAAKPGPPPDK